MNKKLNRLYKWMQIARKLHRSSGIMLFGFILIVSVTGILLGWKSHSNELIMPNAYRGSSIDLKDWLSADSLQTLAFNSMRNRIENGEKLTIDRIDIRPSKGIVKIRFSENIWMVQLDGATGEVLHIGKRHADVIESIHDGSIIDNWLDTNSFFKLLFTSTIGLALILFVLTGFFLWFGPIMIEKMVNAK